ncbi:hypothetical protein N799_06625 [Lysobacter arseniciresistens ZS79]|uniref:Uncharacterized protein n=1 Tax=Lysobacter arseniciresistens ZS79 TaxID=913325 RepID=A0A0A0EZ07_9GAMM|nr:hypothetical protein N799_06625 [Lysobacter arseniciresistens ZS79]
MEPLAFRQLARAGGFNALAKLNQCRFPSLVLLPKVLDARLQALSLSTKVGPYSFKGLTVLNQRRLATFILLPEILDGRLQVLSLSIKR